MPPKKKPPEILSQDELDAGADLPSEEWCREFNRAATEWLRRRGQIGLWHWGEQRLKYGSEKNQETED
jgi:hypothetical protein